MTNPFDLNIQEGWGDDQTLPPEIGVEWLRCPPGQDRVLVVLSSVPIFYKGHWDPAFRLMRRCELPDWCPSDRLGRGCRHSNLGRPRPRYIVVALCLGRQWLWEFGDEQKAQIRPLMDAHGGLLGLPLLLRRPPGRNNPPTWISTPAPEDVPPGPYPEPVDAKAIVFGTWVRQSLKRGTKGGPAPPRADTSGPSGLPLQPDRRPRSGSSPSPGGGPISPTGALAAEEKGEKKTEEKQK